MRERPEIVPFDLSDRLCCPEALRGMDGIFFKLSDFVRFCKLERRMDLAIPLVFQEERFEDLSRAGLRPPHEIDTIRAGG
jgi:hypothetical protein